MKILYFSPRECWPLTTGARLRDYHLARALGRNAAVTYLGLRAPQEPAEELPPAEAGFAEVVIALRRPPYRLFDLIRGAAGPHPVTVLNYWSSEAVAALERILRSARFDTVQIEGVHLIRYLPVIRSAAPGAAIIADWHNIESEILSRYADTAENLPRRLFARRTAGLVAREENTLLAACDCHTVASEREREKLLRRNPTARIHSLPNGVDVGYYANVAPTAEGQEILFVGSMDYHANVDAAVWMAKEAWPILKQRLPELRLTIVGRKPTPEVQALAAEEIAVTGTVDDVRPFYRRAFAVAVPLRVGSGTRLKILEAMAAGVPVVSTRLGAEGLDVVDGDTILLADNASDMAGAIARLQADRPLRARLIENARKLVTDSYDWSSLGQRLYEVHRSAVRSK